MISYRILNIFIYLLSSVVCSAVLVKASSPSQDFSDVFMHEHKVIDTSIASMGAEKNGQQYTSSTGSFDVQHSEPIIHKLRSTAIQTITKLNSFETSNSFAHMENELHVRTENKSPTGTENENLEHERKSQGPLAPASRAFTWPPHDSSGKHFRRPKRRKRQTSCFPPENTFNASKTIECHKITECGFNFKATALPFNISIVTIFYRWWSTFDRKFEISSADLNITSNNEWRRISVKVEYEGSYTHILRVNSSEGARKREWRWWYQYDVHEINITLSGDVQWHAGPELRDCGSGETTSTPAQPTTEQANGPNMTEGTDVTRTDTQASSSHSLQFLWLLLLVPLVAIVVLAVLARKKKPEATVPPTLAITHRTSVNSLYGILPDGRRESINSLYVRDIQCPSTAIGQEQAAEEAPKTRNAKEVPGSWVRPADGAAYYNAELEKTSNSIYENS
ncbi:uncharacterized protein LOC108669330 isoform X3 [Hyalella azteca]|uniref:Uncharacterized protein LOC108669330 isoform X3 n=1 Tax=Hyalella azteca TaxID=294128 RepID=A0A979FRN2_HYAAZ|nr:uncharacterized protein LOC108669330 isoform X3 [Hyalella azteca]